MFTEKQYLDVHKGVAEAHKKLRHQDGVRVAWMGDDPTEDSQGLKTKAEFVMMMVSPTGSIEGDSSENLRDVVRGGFEIVGKVLVGSSPDFRNKETVSSAAMVIGKECVMRLVAMSEGDLCTDDACACVLDGFVPGSVRYEKVQPYPDWVGYRFTYLLGGGDMMEYDANAFIEE